jgi:hypothetical protein
VGGPTAASFPQAQIMQCSAANGIWFRWPLLTTARLSAFKLLDADRVDYGSAIKTGI